MPCRVKKIIYFSVGIVVCMLTSVYVWHFYSVQWYFDEKESYAHQFNIHYELYNLTGTVLEFLGRIRKERSNIKIWAIAGTALGAARHGSIIPWDDDVDFGYMKEDRELLMGVNWKEVGLELVPSSVGFQIARMLNFSDFEGLKYFQKYKHGIFELFECEVRMGEVVYASDFARAYWPKEKLPFAKLFPLRKAPFGPLKIPVAWGVKEQCRRAFGEDYEKRKKRRLVHGVGVLSFYLWKTNLFLWFY